MITETVITDARQIGKTSFSNLKRGDNFTFSDNSGLLKKIYFSETTCGENNAVDLRTGDILSIAPNATVIPVDIHISITANKEL